jgi:diguanylate cyclase (GGDEF)-like protein
MPNVPILALRIVQEDWIFVAIDTFAIVLSLFVAYCVLKRRNLIIMQFALSTLISISLIAIVFYGSANHLFWFFPGAIAFFFLLKPKAALLYSVSNILIVYPVLQGFDTAMVLTFYTAILPTIMFSFFCAKALQVQHADLSIMASQDYLTQTGNRRAFQQDSTQSLDAFVRHKTPCSLILLDMDHFKQLNDNYGHKTGDEVLKNTTFLIKQRLRRSDRLYRIGGEEFAILLNHGTLKEAVSVAQDLKSYLEKFRNTDLPKSTVSIGLAQLKAGESIDDMMQRADKALYASKDGGRDMITTAH